MCNNSIFTRQGRAFTRQQARAVSEIKNYSPWVRSTTGHPSVTTLNGGTYSFGNTAERLAHRVLGSRRRGVSSMGAFDHRKGTGFVAAHDGDYVDALKNNKAMVRLLVHETTGGLDAYAAKHLNYLAREAAKNEYDGTDYRNSRTASFAVHYSQRIVTACVAYGAEGILKGIRSATRARLRGGARSSAA